MNRFTPVAAALFISAGVGHFVAPDFFEAVVPDWMPNASATNQVSGAAEIALGAGLLHPRTRRFSGWGLLALTAVVFPANIDMAINDVDIRRDATGEFQRYPGEVDDLRNWIRLPFQALIAWVVWRGAELGESARA